MSEPESPGPDLGRRHALTQLSVIFAGTWILPWLKQLSPEILLAQGTELHRHIAARSTEVSAEKLLFFNPHQFRTVDVICEIGARLRQTNLLVAQRASRNINEVMAEQYTVGQRIADRVATFGGSWTFIFIFGGILLTWMATNSILLARFGHGENGAQWDPYPYILLNLLLSTLAALQAPVIMMSQNRAAEKDRLAAEQDFKVNLKSELMLEELVRKQRERDGQMDAVMRTLQTVQAPAERSS